MLRAGFRPVMRENIGLVTMQSRRNGRGGEGKKRMVLQVQRRWWRK
jgi:hypothetical protein